MKTGEKSASMPAVRRIQGGTPNGSEPVSRLVVESFNRRVEMLADKIDCGIVLLFHGLYPSRWFFNVASARK